MPAPAPRNLATTLAALTAPGAAAVPPFGDPF
jgi:hypothetical protein